MYRRAKGDLIETYKMMHGKYDEDKIPHWQMSVGITRGHELKLFKSRAQTQVRRHYFTYRVVDAWNSLPASVVGAPSISAFECRLDKHWRDQECLYDHEKIINTMTRRREHEDLDIEVY